MHHRRSALRRVVPLLLLASLILPMGLSAQLAQQPPPRPAATPQPASNPNDLASEGTAALSGVVTDATTHEPIPGVMVYLGFQGRGAVGRLSRQISDDKGRFVFTDLAAGSLYFINASKFGYLDGHFGVGAGGLLGGLITLTDGQWLSTTNVVMQRLGSIGGIVLDEHGEPAVGVFVRVLSQGLIGGQRRLVPGQTAKTDDRGAYRLVDLLPGRYMLHVPFIQQTYSSTLTPADLAGLTAEQIAAGRSAPDPPLAIETDSNARLAVGFIPPPSPVNGRAQTYLSMFYPGVASIGDATTVDLHPGENRQAVNFSLRAVPATAISGVVDGPAQSLQGLVVRLLPEGLEDAGGTFETATATTGSDGRFTFLNVPAASVHHRDSPIRDRRVHPAGAVDIFCATARDTWHCFRRRRVDSRWTGWRLLRESKQPRERQLLRSTESHSGRQSCDRSRGCAETSLDDSRKVRDERGRISGRHIRTELNRVRRAGGRRLISSGVVAHGTRPTVGPIPDIRDSGFGRRIVPTSVSQRAVERRDHVGHWR